MRNGPQMGEVKIMLTLLRPSVTQMNLNITIVGNLLINCTLFANEYVHWLKFCLFL